MLLHSTSQTNAEILGDLLTHWEQEGSGLGPWMSCLDRVTETDEGEGPSPGRGWQGEALTGVGRCRV